VRFPIFAFFVLSLAGCTIAPRVVTPSAPSIDGGIANSGIICAAPGGFVVTPFFAERYADLCRRYGDRLNPPMLAPRWMTPTGTNTFLLSPQGLAAFGELDFYYYQHLAP